MPESVVLLHGFGGTHRAWDAVRRGARWGTLRPLAFDLPGHGEAADAARRSPSARASRTCCAQPERFILLRLLAGRARRVARRAGRARARLAARARLEHPPAIENEDERADAAAPTTSSPISSNASHTSGSSSAGARQPLFAQDPPEVRALAARTSGATAPTRSPQCCAASALGRCSRCWDRLGELAHAGDGDRRLSAMRSSRAPRCADGELAGDGGLVVGPVDTGWRWRAPWRVASVLALEVEDAPEPR